MDKETKRRVRITLLGILGLVVTIIGISYAAFSANIVGKEVNMVNTGCLKVDMTDNGSINIENAMPETDESGLSGDPYTFSIENTCTVNAYYDTTINVMNTSNLDNISKVKLALEGDSYLAPTMESNLQTGELLDTDITGVAKTYKLDEGYLRVGEKKTFSLRTWIDYDVEAIEGSLENKIIINSRAEDNGAVAYNTSTTAYKAIKGNTIIKKVDYGSIAPSSSQTSGVIEIKDDDGITYHYRGNPNNHIVFGTYKTTETISYRDSSGVSKQITNTSGNNIKWRILSTNSDGSINIIKDDVIGEDTYNNASTKLNSFYTTHLSSLEGYIDTTSKFCNETTDSSGNYLAPIRVNKNNPTVKCVSNNMVTKIGLPTVDDIMFSGGVNNTQNTSFFLYQNIYGFMTGSNQSSSNIFISSPSKSIGTLAKTSSIGIRPVITLAKDIKLEGEGTEANPFYISNRFGSTTLNDEYKKDTIAPIINYARVDERWSNQNKHIEISAKDNSTGSGIAGFIVKTTSTVPDKNDSGWKIATTNRYTTVNSYDNGTYYVFVKDNAGNISEGKQVTIGRVDKINPVCTLSIDPSGTLSSYKTLKINTTETNIDLEGYSWKHTKSAEDVIKVSENGVYTATITDLAGNKGQCSAVVTTIKENTVNEVMKTGSIMDNVSSKYVTASTGIDFSQAPSDTNGKGIYQRAGTGENGEYPVYYYRGNVDNNNLAFNGFCWKIVRTTETGGVKLIYNGVYNKGCNNTGSSATIGNNDFNYPSSMVETKNTNTNINPTTLEQTEQESKLKKLMSVKGIISPADVGYMYGKRYLTNYLYSDELPSTVIYGNDVTYSNGKYTLKDTITSTNFETDQENIGKNHHYFCADGTSSCSIVYYMYQISYGSIYYIELGDGNNIEQALEKMLTESTNENSSTIKQYIDYWYNETMSKKTNELEDTVWCNDRSIYNKAGFDKDTNANVTDVQSYLDYFNSLLLFGIYDLQNMYGKNEGKTINPSLKCPSKNDSFTVSTANGNGKLSYPVALLTGAEATLAGHGLQGNSKDSYLTTGRWFWFSSPCDFFVGGATVSGVNSDGRLDASGLLDVGYVDESNGIRPSVSLKLGTSISGGNGTSDNPYIVGEQPDRME